MRNALNFAKAGKEMGEAVAMAEIWRGPFLESTHLGHAVVCDAGGEILHAWGNPDLLVLPRSSGKMIQALPLIESGAAAAYELKAPHLALACASHSGERFHVKRVTNWLAHIGLPETCLHCGPTPPLGEGAREELYRAGGTVSPLHSDCSGKHAGFLSVAQHIGAGPDYLDPNHPVQKQVLEAWERMTGEATAGFAIDGCSAPNHASRLCRIAAAMAGFAGAKESTAQATLVQAMMAHPELVAGTDRSCTELMRACDGGAALKAGAEGFYVGILPEKKLGIALKIADGNGRAAETAMAGLLIKFGVLDPMHPMAIKYTNGPMHNFAGHHIGYKRLAPPLVQSNTAAI